MAGFGSKKGVKSKNNKTTREKKHKVQEKNLNYTSEPKIKKNVNQDSLDNEVINLPIYCGSPDKSREIDLFIVDCVMQSKKEIIKPYFIGRYVSRSFDMQIKSSMVDNTPRDLVEDTSDGVINLKRK